MREKASRNNTIDLFRFLAACFVVFFHQQAFIPYRDNWYRNLCGLLWLGVPAFFVISGYCILIAIKHNRAPNHFLIRRFFRIFPAYWLSLLLVFAIVAVVAALSGVNNVTEIPRTPGAILATISLLTSPATHVKGINWVYWSLTYELFFYLVIYLVVFLPRKYWLVAIIAVTAVSVTFPPDYTPFFFLKYWPSFALGIACYYLLHNAEGNKMLIASLFALSIGIIIRTQNSAWLLVCGVTATAIIVESFWPLRKNFLSDMGELSYSIYLFHVPVCCYIFGRFKTAGIQKHLALNIAFDCTALLITIALSVVVYKYIELPAINYGKKLITRLTLNKPGIASAE